MYISEMRRAELSFHLNASEVCLKEMRYVSFSIQPIIYNTHI